MIETKAALYEYHSYCFRAEDEVLALILWATTV